jgi:hypothetical protein
MMQGNPGARHNGQRYPDPSPKPAPTPWDAPTAAFLADVRRYAFMRSGPPSHQFFEQMKSQARSACPHLPGHMWARLMGEVAKICGV